MCLDFFLGTPLIRDVQHSIRTLVLYSVPVAVYKVKKPAQTKRLRKQQTVKKDLIYLFICCKKKYIVHNSILVVTCETFMFIENIL